MYLNTQGIVSDWGLSKAHSFHSEERIIRFWDHTEDAISSIAELRKVICHEWLTN